MAADADGPAIPLLTPYKMGKFNLSHRYSHASWFKIAFKFTLYVFSNLKVGLFFFVNSELFWHR